MAEDWAIDVKKYAPDADDKVIAAIVRHCGIALRSRDASLVSFTDTAETDLVRESFCRKKLGLTDSDAVLDKAIAAVGKVMKDDQTRNRVTVYYLLAEKFDKLGLFGAAEKVAAAPVVAAVVAPVVAAAAAVPPVAAAPVAAPPRPRVVPAPVVEEPKAGFGLGKLLALLALLALAAFLLWWLFGRSHETTTSTTTTETTTAAPPAPVAAVAPAIPEGAGVVASEVDGKPKVSVYFDTAKSDVSPDFATVATTLKTWVDTHPDTHLNVSGYNDPRGNAALNAQLSKDRAFAVRDALIALGIPETALTLVKPTDTSDEADSLAHGRRVDVTVADAS
jgi:outer membrane protein OmpA-like peptidoglycan-associated protein